MANKAVVSVAALGIGAYTLNEQFKDWQVKKERQKREQEAQDRADVLQRRLEESQKKKGQKRKNLLGTEGDILMERLFTMRVYAQVEDILYEIIMKVGEAAKKDTYSNLQQLNLPLMDNMVVPVDRRT